MRALQMLLVGGDAQDREALVATLRGAGHRVVSVPDAPAAAEALGSSGFDTLLLDLGMADLSLATLRQALAPTQANEPDSLDAAERRHIALTLRYTGGNRRRAALLLGISRSTLLHKVRKYGLE
jgi:DNA-binding NtrC family response regulator